MNISLNEFHISRKVREECDFNKTIYSSSGNVIFRDFKAVQEFQTKLNNLFDSRNLSEKRVSAGSINAMGLIDEIFHIVCGLYRKNKNPDCMTRLLADLDTYFKKEEIDAILLEFMQEFPPVDVYQNKITAQSYLEQKAYDESTKKERSNREQVLEELIMLHLANENPAFHPFQILFDDAALKTNPLYTKTWNQIKAFFVTQPVFGPKNNDLINMFKEPVIASPTSLKGQLDYIRTYWKDLLGDWIRLLLEGMDILTEEEKAMWHPTNGGAPDMAPPSYENLMKEYERFSPDREWMPKVVLMAKTVLVWLDQLRKKYKRDIYTLDQIPDEELDALRDEGFTGLWLIGLWERSYASRRIKQINGNPEAAASAYSLWDYEIAQNLGGWSALENLRARCWQRGIRLASDMVPNHTGMDGKWVIEHPDYFITSKDCPFPQYSFNGENLSQDSRVSLYLEDHYYSKTDCAVCFKRVDNYTGDVTYIYHGNDGTGLPWNDTAQIDFLNPTAREAVMGQIMKVAANFPIIRFDAAMVLAKKHIRRLWYPEPGHGGDIASRSRYALTTQQFEDAIPNEFWREVVDRCAKEMPDTLLLAEAFWMMEGYFTRTLGMHRVYNSAFMNMLKKEENQKYRDTVKNTIKFDPQILKRFVNFMNNPDEETAVAQFGKGDKYFGVCTLMSTMPGLPMFGHGQLEGFEEKYGMEYTKAYKDEQVDENLMSRHRTDIFPLLHKRYLFAGVENFLFYDVWNNGVVNENIFAYSNGTETERTIVFYNNKYERAAGWIKQSCEYAVKTGSGENDVVMKTKSLAEGLNLTGGSDKFCIFREHHSGLWFIRRCDDLINSGMFVSLNGFECQVYLDVQQVTDTADKKYSKLHDILNGAGVEDFDVAWQEYKYKDLYESLKKFISQEFIGEIKTLFTPNNKKNPQITETLTDILERTKQDAIEFYTLQDKFDETETQEFTDSKNATKNSAVRKMPARITTPEQKFNYFSKKIEFLYTAFENAQKDYTAETVSKPGRTVKTSAIKQTDEKIIFDGLNSYENSALILCCFSAISSSNRATAERRGYARKLAEYISLSGKCNPDTRNILKRLLISLDIRDLNFGPSNFLKSTYTVAYTLVQSEDSPLLTGANEFNGTRWFQKELMDQTLWFGLVEGAMSSTRIMKEQSYRLYKTLSAAKENAEYKCENFIKVFEPQKKEAKKRGRPATKTAEAKATPAAKAPSKTKTKAVKASKDSAKKS